jgi:hypothetical protein
MRIASVVIWIYCVIMFLIPIILCLASLKRDKKPALDKWLRLIPEYKLALNHPVTLHFIGIVFFLGLVMLLSSIRFSFPTAFDELWSCSFYTKAQNCELILAYVNFVLLLTHRAQATMVADQKLSKFLKLVFRPFVAIYLILALIMINIERFYGTVLDPETQFCYGLPSTTFTLVILVGDAFISIGLFLLFLVPLRRVSMQNKAALKSGKSLRSGGNGDDIDMVIVRNFQSFLLLWFGTVGYILIIYIAVIILMKNFLLAEIVYVFVGLPLISILIGLLMVIWKALDFDGTPFNWTKKEMMTESPQRGDVQVVATSST